LRPKEEEEEEEENFFLINLKTKQNFFTLTLSAI
jgi:hypothetical protein